MSIAAKLALMWGSSLTRWSATDKQSGITLSGGNLIATNGSPADDRSVRATIARSTGKWKFEVSTSSETSGRPAVGLAEAGQGLNTPIGGADSIGAYANGTVLGNSGELGSIPAFSPGVLSVEVDLDAMLVYFQPEGEARSSGFDISYMTAPLYPILDLFGAGDSATGNFGGATFVVPMTSGYRPWG